MLKTVSWKGATALAVTAASVIVLSPALAAPFAKKRPAAVSLSVDPVSSFTPANADPKLAAALAGHGLSLEDLKFTPAPAKGRPSQLRIAIRARAVAPSVANPGGTAMAQAGTPLNPTSYNLGVAVGWRRFAVAGDVAKTKSGDPAQGSRESALVGVSYSLSKFTGKVAVGADRAADKPLPAFQRGNNYSLDVGGSYSLSKRIALTGGVRYQVERDRLSALKDERRDSQAVYVGTAVKF